ncbi:MAG TPA: hypothetical protein VMY35_10245 [Phycisphaerae bacterium]|nr:hypothetical protein [Phycisphaerae bacterium]
MTAISRDDARKFLKRAGVAQEHIDRQLGEVGEPIPKVRNAHTRREGYGAKRTASHVIGRNFRSDFERRVAERLWARQKAGEISELTFEPRVKLLGVVAMIPDFRYIEDGQVIHHEAKGYADQRWNMQRKLWALVGPTEYRVTHMRGPDEVIRPAPNDELIELVLNWLRKDAT